METETGAELTVPETQHRSGVPDLAPRNMAEAMDFAKMVANSNFVPTAFRGKAGDVLCAMTMGYELGLKPMRALQNIAVINGRPCIWGDLMIALVQSSGLLESIKETDDGDKATCEVKRKGDSAAHVVTFSMADAKTAGLLSKGGPWSNYPKRMRQLRARGFALRDKFADALGGLISREEAEDYP
ncbi:MAG: hypothetical protein ACREQE_05990, partial [Candidatus Binataceae bacterium]